MCFAFIIAKYICLLLRCVLLYMSLYVFYIYKTQNLFVCLFVCVFVCHLTLIAEKTTEARHKLIANVCFLQLTSGFPHLLGDSSPGGRQPICNRGTDHQNGPKVRAG